MFHCSQHLFDDDILDYFRSQSEKTGSGYQTMINLALREAVAKAKDLKQEEPLTVEKLRQVLREELHLV